MSFMAAVAAVEAQAESLGTVLRHPLPVRAVGLAPDYLGPGKLDNLAHLNVHVLVVVRIREVNSQAGATLSGASQTSNATRHADSARSAKRPIDGPQGIRRASCHVHALAVRAGEEVLGRIGRLRLQALPDIAGHVQALRRTPLVSLLSGAVSCHLALPHKARHIRTGRATLELLCLTRASRGHRDLARIRICVKHRIVTTSAVGSEVVAAGLAAEGPLGWLFGGRSVGSGRRAALRRALRAAHAPWLPDAHTSYNSYRRRLPKPRRPGWGATGFA
mmetsp:Transcript_53154/g.137342  ORF Transcript_53154/g.137342 Transcript_53154/m.137342 type:complete len:276 (+) Transcript_53154:479-1306(+)